MNRGKMDDLGAERKHSARAKLLANVSKLSRGSSETQKEVKNINLHCIDYLEQN